MTLHLDDARWRAAIDANLRGDATPAQSEFLEGYEPQGAEQRAEAAFLASLAEGPNALDGDTESAPLPDWLGAAIDTHVRTAVTTRPLPAVPPDEPVSRARRPLLVAAAAILIAAGASAFLLRGSSEELHQLPTGLIAAVPSVATQPASEAADVQVPWQVASGSVRLTESSSALPVDQPLRVESTLCLERPGHSICANADSQVTARSSGALALHIGSATVRSEDADDVRVELDDVTVHAGAHSVVVIDRQAAGWSVTVDSGTATVTELGSARRLKAGESLQRGAQPTDSATASPPAVKRTVKASALLARARARRRDGDPRGAMQTYAELIRQHPRSPAAQTARMSLAQLQLDRGKTKDALRSFRAYLKRGGALAEDAAYGEIRALRALGRTAEAKRAAAAFKQRYPGSPYGAKLKP